jgi:hypothetical protein
MGLELQEIIQDFSDALKAADSLRPEQSGRGGRVYKPGIGPLNEDKAVALILEQLRLVRPSRTRTQLRDCPIQRLSVSVATSP